MFVCVAVCVVFGIWVWRVFTVAGVAVCVWVRVAVWPRTCVAVWHCGLVWPRAVWRCGGVAGVRTEKKRGGPWRAPLLCGVQAAVSYSPTPWRVQYHRRWQS